MSDIQPTLTLGDATATVELPPEEAAALQASTELDAAAKKVGIPTVSDEVKSLVDHFQDPEAEVLEQSIVGSAKPSDLIRACQLLAELHDMNTLEGQAFVHDQGSELKPATRRLLQWIFLARVRIRSLLPFIRSAAVISYLPPGGRFTPQRTAERVGCAHTVILHLGARRKERLTVPMRGYQGNVYGGQDDYSVEFDGRGHAFHKNMWLTPGVSKLEVLIRRIKKGNLTEAQKTRKQQQVVKSRQDSGLDETLFDEAIASRPDLENGTIMGLGLRMLLALRAFGESRKITHELDQLARKNGVVSGMQLVAQWRERLQEGGDSTVLQWAARRDRYDQLYSDPGAFDFPDYVEVHGRDALEDIPAEEVCTVPGVDGRCLRVDHARARRVAGERIPSPLMFMEDFTGLFERHGVPMFEGRRVLEAEIAESDGWNVTWAVRLEGDEPGAEPRIMRAEDFLGGQYVEIRPQVVDVVNGPQIRPDSRGPRDEELRFARQGVSISLSPGDTNPRFAECRRGKRKS